MKHTALLVAALLTIALAACASRPDAPQYEQEAAKVTETAPEAVKATKAAKATNVRIFTLGDFSAIALRDGGLSLPNDNKVLGVGRTPAEVAAVLSAAGQPTDHLELSIQPLLIQTPERVLLFDTGAGANMGANGGRLPTSMAEAGIATATVTDIFISHAHGDHVGGLVNAAGQLNFPGAAIHISAPEWAYLKGMSAQAASTNGIPNHAALIAAITPKIAEFAPDADIFPGVVKAVAIRGHTPGHSGYLITSKRTSVLYIGDTAHHFVVSLRKPDWTIAFDADPATAQASRRTLLTDSARSGQLIYAVHFPFPGLGKIQHKGDGFVWVPK